MNKKKLGNIGENIAIEYLKKNGYEIIKRNFYSKFGEIDLICKKNTDELIFVEVKTRSENIETAFKSVTFNKQKKIYRTADFFYKKNSEYKNYSSRFDVIAIKKNKSVEKIQHLINAFNPVFF